MNERFLSRRQVAEFLGISKKTVDRMRERRELPFVRLGRRVVITPGDLQRHVERCRVS